VSVKMLSSLRIIGLYLGWKVVAKIMLPCRSGGSALVSQPTAPVVDYR
jgi:hypothetical protein